MKIRTLTIGCTFIIAACIQLWQCNTVAPQKEEANFFLNVNDSVKYVGMDKCKVCHEDHYNTFIETGMGQSFGLATKEKSKALFNQKPVYDAKTDMYFAADWVNNKLRITEFRLKGTDTLHKRSQFISYIIGSGHHTNSHLWEENGYLFQAPLTFYTQKQKWDLPPGFETTNTHFNRKIDFECMSCHNAMPQIAQGSVNKFTKIPAGIDCERCHGPGELHVQQKTNGILVDTKKEADRSIVNPARLPWKLQVDVCQRCHLQGNNVLKPGKTFADFRPGKKLSEVFEVYMPAQESSGFFMAGHADRLQKSACFVASNKNNTEAYNAKLNFTCITCHNPHVSVRKTNTEKFNNACKNCHQSNGQSKLIKCSENAVKISAKNNNCVTCHMPGNQTGDIPHVTVHDHFIRKNYNTPSTKINTGKLYAVNNPAPNSRTELEAYITWFEKFDNQKIYLQKAEEILAKNNKETALQIHFYYANVAFTEIVKTASKLDKKNADAWTCYRVAKAYDRTNNLSAAVEWYAMAHNKMPLHADFSVEYANALIRADRYNEAEPIINAILKEQPSNELANINAGTVAYKQNKLAMAKNYWKKALQLNPDNPTTHLYLVEFYTRLKEPEQAKKEAAEVLRIDPKNTQVRGILNP